MLPLPAEVGNSVADYLLNGRVRQRTPGSVFDCLYSAGSAETCFGVVDRSTRLVYVQGSRLWVLTG